MKYLLTIAYDGRRYCGYQVQKNGVSIQEMLGKAAETVFGRPCSITGCSRTDSGVHANDFKATLDSGGDAPRIPADKVAIAMNCICRRILRFSHPVRCRRSFMPATM